METKTQIPDYLLVIVNIVEKAFNNEIELPKSKEFETLFELRKEGCEIGVILAAVFSIYDKWKEKTGTDDFEIDFEKVEKKRAEKTKKRKVISNAMRTLLELSPLSAGLFTGSHPEVNPGLLKMQKAIKEF
ncbi:MAG: hypothetical protein NT178_09385 [Proteobacteria bacterium]|nr:hypothetical protein [Pseudomonadota bacterium]